MFFERTRQFTDGLESGAYSCRKPMSWSSERCAVYTELVEAFLMAVKATTGQIEPMSESSHSWIQSYITVGSDNVEAVDNFVYLGVSINTNNIISRITHWQQALLMDCVGNAKVKSSLDNQNSHSTRNPTHHPRGATFQKPHVESTSLARSVEEELQCIW